MAITSSPSSSSWLVSSRLLLLLFVVMSFHASFVSSDFAKDRAECEDKLIGLATCLTYVDGMARAPTPDCCNGLKDVLAKSLRCLCILIEDRNQPELGIKINVTLAMSLPSACHTTANISSCPSLLNLPPGSKDAEIFEEYGKRGGGIGAGSGNGTSSGNATASPGKRSDGDESSGRDKKRLAAAAVHGGAWVSPLLAVALLVLGG